MSTEDHILYGVEGRVATITLNRPERRNVIDPQMMDRFEDLLEVADGDEGVRVVVIRSTGTTFCAGYDMGGAPLAANSDDRSHTTPFDPPKADWSFLHRKLYYTRRDGMRWLRMLWDLRKPVIGQVEGKVLAGGMDIVHCCDLVYAADDAEFGLPQARAQGLIHTFPFLPLLVGMRRAKELTFTGDSITGVEAAAMGMVNRSMPAADLAAEVTRMAARVALAPPEMLMANKFACNRVYETMGLDGLVRNANEWNAVGGFNSVSTEFSKVAVEDGMKAAIAFRDAPWMEER